MNTEHIKLPNSWSHRKLNEIATVTAGGTPSTKIPDYWGGDIPWMNSGEINLKRIKSVEGRITELGLSKSSTKIIPKNSILLALAGQGTTRGKVAINEIDLCTNQSLAAIMPSKECNYEFLFQNLESRYQELRKLSTGDSGRGGLNLTIIRDIVISLPPLPEQQKIADILTTVDHKLENIESQIAEYTKLKTGLMQQLLTKGIGHTKFVDSELGMIPEGWEIMMIRNIGEVITGTTPPTKNTEYYSDSRTEYLWAAPGDLGDNKYIHQTNKTLSKLGFQQIRRLPPKSILVTCVGSTIGKIGLAIKEMSTNQQINSIVCKKDVEPDFVYYYLQLKKDYIKSLAGTHAVPLLNKTSFSNILVPIPPLSEQIQIASILTSVDDKTESLQQKKQEFSNLKKGLMEQLLTGRIRVKV